MERAETIPQGSRGRAASKSAGSVCVACGECRKIQAKGLCLRCYHREWRKSEDRSRWASRQYPDGCRSCGTKEAKHQGKGLCSGCSSKEWAAQNKDRVRELARSTYAKHSLKVRTKSREHWVSMDDAARARAADSAFRRKYGGNGILCLERAGFKCEGAECDYERNRRVLEIHHRDGDHSNNHLDNLMCLCPTCHKEQHYRS